MDRLKQIYLSRVLSETHWLINDLQEQAVNDWNLSDSGGLENSIGRHFSLKAGDDAGQLTISVLKYARFLDMGDPRRKLRREGYHLYNRIIWGVVYNRTLPALKTGFTEELRENVMKALEKSGESFESGASRELAKDLKTNFFKYKF